MYVSIRRQITAIFIVASLCCGASAYAKKLGAFTPLMVLDSEPIDGVRAVRKGEVMISSRVVYKYLAVADEDIFGFDGKVGDNSPKLLAAKGSQLFKVVALGKQITFCLVEHKQVGTFNGVFVNNSDKHTCFIDNDADGRFDSSYDLRTNLSSVPIYFRVEAGGNPLPKAVSYSEISPDLLNLPISFEIVLGSLNQKKGTAHVSMRLNSESGFDYLSGGPDVVITSGGSDVEVTNARLVLSPGVEKTINVQVKKGISKFDLATFLGW